jgi:tetratricopeptide (TPR) repeat protein
LALPRKKEKRKQSGKENKQVPKWYFIIIILIPVFFFILLEFSLRIFNYGKDLPQWIDARRGKYIINPDLAYRYFSNVENIPTTIEDVFDQKKKENAYRVFVIGGSSAAGFPYLPMGSFSRYVRKRLEIAYPNTTIEVINLGLSAVNTYTIRDIVPGILGQKPDLILFYAGHNEYYGALGVGSLESAGTSRTLVNLSLYLNKYKTVQLLKNFIKWSSSLFAAGQYEKKTGTLMSRMAQDQYIPLNSEKYYAGLDQFSENLKDIIEMAKEHNVPLILGTLASNLKDQKPFISVSTPGYPMADEVYQFAEDAMEKNKFLLADSLFRIAKDLDALRFRAPEDINDIIKKLGNEYKIPVVGIDSVFSKESPHGIIGNNLMTDHLHPTVEGYHLIGKSYYEIMNKYKFLPIFEAEKYSFSIQDSITKEYFVFTDLDSLIGNYRIMLLKNDWPFISKEKKKPVEKIIQSKNFIDSIAGEYINNKISWEIAHLNAAEKYLKRDDLEGYLKHMNVLIYQYPIVVEYYDQTALVLLERGKYDEALSFLYKRNEVEQGAFAQKWIGTIALHRGDKEKAIYYLTKSLELNSSDPQVLYNLAGAYSLKKDYKAALSTIEKCLKVDPGHEGAEDLKIQLINAIESNRL